MTEEQLKEGNRISCEITKLEERISRFNNFVARLENKESEKESIIEIQLHENWCYTPYAEVNKKDFSVFCESQIEKMEWDIAALKEKLVAL